MEIKFDVFWNKDLGTFYKDNSIDTLGKEVNANIDLDKVLRIYVNFQVGEKSYTDNVEILDIENKLIRIPFKTDVIKQGLNKFELVAVMKDNSVLPSQTYTYRVDKSLENPNSVEAETNYPILINLLQYTEEKINTIDEAIDRLDNSVTEMKGTVNTSLKENTDIINSRIEESLEAIEESFNTYIESSNKDLNDKFKDYSNETTLNIDKDLNDKFENYLNETTLNIDTVVNEAIKSTDEFIEFANVLDKVSNIEGELSEVVNRYGDIENEYAKKAELHNHSNKNILDNITSAKVTEWNNKSTFSGSYNDLTNKPTIPSLNGYATKDYVNQEINKIDVTNQLTSYVKKNELPTNVSAFSNDKGYLVKEDLGYITPQMFGAKADGVTDDSEAILNAIAALPKNGGTLYFPAGTYIHGDGTTTGLSYQVDTKYPEGHAYYPAPLMQNKGVDDRIGRDIRLIFEEYTNLTIKGDGAILQSHENNGECSNNGFFTFKRCENVIIEGITIDGKRHERGIKLTDYSPGGYDLQRSNIHFNRCKRVIIRNVISKGAMMDGMAIGAGSQTEYNEDFLVEKCKFLDNHRQGISIEGATNVTVRDTECSYNGTGQGILPKSGIDVEAYGNVGTGEQYSYNHNVLIDNCYFVGNGYSNVVVNNNSFNTVIQHCTFKDAWVSAQANGDAKLLYCKMENCGISNGYRYIAHNEIIYNKGGYVMRSTDVSENTISYIEHNTFDLSGSTSTYNSIRLSGKERFRYNHIKNATSNTVEHYPLYFRCEEFVGNKLELTETCSNIDTYIKAKSSANLYKYNTNTGYAFSTVNWNEFYRTDETITRSFNSRDVGYGKLLKLSDFAGIIKMTARYGNQVEEVFICRSIGTYCHHYVFRRNINLSGENLVNIYKDSGKNFYVKFSFTNINATVECSYCYGDSHVEGLQYTDMFTTTTVTESGLTKINTVDTSVFTLSLKTNYDKAYTHSQSAHAPANAQKNSDITKAEIETKLTGIITSHTHEGIGDYIENNWGSENAGKVLMVGADGRVSLYDLSNFNPNAKWFTVTQNYTNVESDFNSTNVKENLPLTIKLNTTNGKKLGNVSVIMNGVDVTSKVYSNGIINIEAVLGDIVITANAMLYTNVVEPNYTNTTDETIWLNGYRYDNFGNLTESPSGIITNTINVKAGDTIRIKGLCSSSGDIGSHVVMRIFKTNGSYYYAQNLNVVNNNGFYSYYNMDKTNNIGTVTLKSGLDIGTIRISGDMKNTIDDVIVTINEEIV